MDREAALLRAAVGTGAVVVAGPSAGSVADALAGAPDVRWTHCPPDPDAPPLWPWTRLTDPVETGTVEMGTVVPTGFAVTAGLADRIAAAGTTVVVQDVQHADVGSLAVLRHLARAAAPAGMLLVVTHDGSPGRHPAELAQTLAELARVRGATPLGPATTIAALLAEAAEEFRAGRPRDGAARCVEAADLATAADLPEALAEAALVVQGAGDADVVTRAVLLCDRALTHWTTPSVTRARLLARRAGLLAEGDQGSPDDGVEALAAAEEAGDPDALLDAVRARMWHLDRAGDADERLRLAGIAVDTGLRTGQLMAAVRGELWRLDVSYQRHDLRGVDGGVARLRDLATGSGRAVADWHAHRVEAARAALAGRFAAARAASEAAHEVAGRLGDDLARLTTDVFAGLLALLRGDPGELREGWRDRLDAHPHLPLTVAAAALSRHQVGETEEALSRYERLRHLLREPSRGARRLGLLQHLTELALRLGDVEAAGWAYPWWLPWASAGGLPGGADSVGGGAAARQLGRLAALLGRTDEAVARLTEAVEGNTRLQARPWLVHTWLDLAPLRPGGGFARRALVEARRLDMPGAVRAAAALTGDPLTVREREIAALVAEALSNRDIAARLVLSERTVESHVRHILAKLDLPNRTALTAYVLSGSRSA